MKRKLFKRKNKLRGQERKQHMKLTFRDRITLETILPERADLLTQAVSQDIREKTKVTQDEIEEAKLERVGSGYVWNEENTKTKNIEFTDAEINLLKDGVERLDKEKNITKDNVTLCQKIKDLDRKKEGGN